ncbi:hypothetical protein PFISCL1PPCAC_25994, partial [Pristionchus fissidentatus]
GSPIAQSHEMNTMDGIARRVGGPQATMPAINWSSLGRLQAINEDLDEVEESRVSNDLQIAPSDEPVIPRSATRANGYRMPSINEMLEEEDEIEIPRD